MRGGGLLVGWALTSSRASGEEDLYDYAALWREAHPRVDAARYLERGCPEARTELRALDELLRPALKAARKAGESEASDAFVAMANQLLTVAAYPKVLVREEYLTVDVPVMTNTLTFRVPRGPTWARTYLTEDRLEVVISQKRPDDSLPRRIRVHRYRWDTVHSDVGGEDAQGLADAIREAETELVELLGGKVGPLLTRRISTQFNRAHYYEVEELDIEAKTRVRRLEYYVKARTATYNLEITEFPALPTGDPVTAWQAGKDDPELEAVLASIWDD
jgi:hypothetical protein